VLSAAGNVFSAGQVIPFAAGGVDSPSIAPMALFGEAGPEAIMRLQRVSDGRLGVASSGGGNAPRVIINNYSDAQPTDVGTTPSGDVSITLRRAMDAAAADSIANGAGRRVLGQ